MKKKTTIIQKKGESRKTAKKSSFTVVAIGASAGGLEAITSFLQNLSPDTGMAYIFVQHLSPDHKSILTALLSKETSMKVQEVEDMDRMEPNNVYVIPYNKEIVVTNGHIKLIPRPKNTSTNLSVDVLFSSLAITHKKNVIGIVLSGNGSDGTAGLREIKLAGGITFAQDITAKYTSMPNSAIAKGVVDFVLSPKRIAKEIMLMAEHPLLKVNEKKVAEEDKIPNDDPALKVIFQLLHKQKNADFSHYKMNTVKRRILRRMLIRKTKTIKSYAALLTKKNNELDLLYKDLLINVTEFFRDTDAFALLKKTVLSKLLKSKKHGETLRIWVAACATGEEVYSIAMTLIELQDNKTNAIPFQIFASDLSNEAIQEARNGEYSLHQLKNVSTKRLQRFFSKTKDKYRISQPLRNVCVFAQHNILSDPPFSRMDFISCRNFLIYLEPSAQKKAIATFHYALSDGGYLMLGKSETIGTSTQLFSLINKPYKIYSRKSYAGVNQIPELIPRASQTRIDKPIYSTTTFAKKMPLAHSTNLGLAFDNALLERYVPASVVINYDMEILQFRGQTSRYLKQSSGKATFNILKMANSEITFELRNVIHHAIKSQQVVRKLGVEIEREDNTHTFQIVNLEVAPFKIEGSEPLLIIIFTGQHIDVSESLIKGVKNNSVAKDRRLKKLEEELASARYDMGSITHDQEAVNEELQSANEEIVSSNEELQSLNEELETSKEEIESTNEELTTTNQELNVRIQQVEELYSYYEGILSTIHEPMLILDKSIRVKSASKSFCKLFGVKEDDCIGVSLYKLGNNQWNIPRLKELLEEIVQNNNRFDNFEVEHSIVGAGKRSMVLNAHRIIQKSKREDLIVLSIADITEVKKLAMKLQLKERKVLEVALVVEKKMLKAIGDSNSELMEAKQTAELKTKLAEEAVQSKQQFLSNMSHEIRTPMNAIIGFTKVILKTDLSAKQKEYLTAIKTSGDSLIILINDILDLAKVDAGKMTFVQSPFKLVLSVSAMLHLFETKIQENNLELGTKFDPKIPEMLIGDSVRLNQIILNLVSNAVKFTKNGKITVSVNVLNEDVNTLTIEFVIKDTGIGIPENKIQNIFENFQQASNNTSSLYGGTGLGLAIVKQLIEQQGGDISVDSKINKGSTFSFRLSFQKTDKLVLDEVEPSETDKEIRNIKVLVVEDVILNQLLMKTILDDFGFERDIASNGKIAIEKLRENTYDIVLMDLQMPEMNGFDTTSYIRNEMNSNIPIVALTADVTTVDVEKCKAVGMNDYVAKPIDENILYTKIISLVNKIKTVVL